MKKTIEYLAKAIDYLEKCELESPYRNAVDINSAKVAIQIVELEHKIEDARQLNRLEDVHEYQKDLDKLTKQTKTVE